MLTSINLALATLCGANCIFCPSDRGDRQIRVMSLELAKEIIDEVSEPVFQRIQGTRSFVLGENGDLFLNQHCLEIMRYIRAKCPGIRIIIFTNFQNTNQATLEAIHQEKLVDFINCNIDSVDANLFYKIKGLDLNKVLNNIRLFFDLRRQYASNIPVQIYSITLYTYLKAVYDNFGILPAKADLCLWEYVYDDFDATQAYLQKMIDPTIDRIVKVDKVMCWAERERVNIEIDYTQYHCTNLARIRQEAFIAPNGDWYVCCYDAKNEVVIGNVGEESLQAIFFSRKRKTIIDHLANQRFHLVGGPCRTVNCCQFVGPVNDQEGKFFVAEKRESEDFCNK